MNQPCLPVPRRRKRTDDGEVEVSFDNIESMDAMEYMAAVMQQASAMPEIFIAQQSTGTSTTIEPTARSSTSIVHDQQRRDHVPIEGSAASIQYLISDRTAVVPPPTALHLPSWNCRAWVDGTLANFSNLRLYLEHCRREGVGGKLTERIPVPSMKDRSGWHVFCLGHDEARGNVGSYFEDKDDDDDMEKMEMVDSDRESWWNNVPPNGHEPSVDIVLQMDQVMVRRVLAYMAHYAQQGWAVSVQRTAWLYALLSRLERPIHRDDAATLFGLLKHVTQLRSKVLNPESQREELARYNVLICILGLYFEQGGGYHNIFAY
ncbi:hypothetical protein MHU86_3072 [Fragilaria crotonensis]|nr:hypothetical protein MHU86_3072 [Fragilaria crotonensis]